MTEAYTLSMPDAAYVSYFQAQREKFGNQRQAEVTRAWKNVNYFKGLADMRMALGIAAYQKYSTKLVDTLDGHYIFIEEQLNDLRDLNAEMESDYPPY